MTNTHTYPVNWLLADYARSGIGLALTAGPLILIRPAMIFSFILAALALLFLIFLARTWRRHQTIIETSEHGVLAKGPAQSNRVAWDQLINLKLRYYSTQRNRENGWLTLTLKDAAGGSVEIESPLTGFSEILNQALAAAHDQGMVLDDTTVANLTAAGYRLPGVNEAELQQKNTVGGRLE